MRDFFRKERREVGKILERKKNAFFSLSSFGAEKKAIGKRQRWEKVGVKREKGEGVREKKRRYV